jgi:hypothetical protein
MQTQGITHFHRVRYDHLHARKHTRRQHMAPGDENSDTKSGTLETIYVAVILAVFVTVSLFGLSALLDLIIP